VSENDFEDQLLQQICSSQNFVLLLYNNANTIHSFFINSNYGSKQTFNLEKICTSKPCKVTLNKVFDYIFYFVYNEIRLLEFLSIYVKSR
jgi:hypothetical protein